MPSQAAEVQGQTVVVQPQVLLPHSRYPQNGAQAGQRVAGTEKATVTFSAILKLQLCVSTSI